MNSTERSIVKMVAKVAPWLAPIPSGYFVARSGMAHMALPFWVALVAAAIIETLGITTVHTALWLADWNASKRKSDSGAPVLLAVALGAVYIVVTLGLVVALEIAPSLATYASGLFPLLAVVGAINLALISRQEWREAAAKQSKAEAARARAERRANRESSKPPMVQAASPDSASTKQRAAVIIAATPGISGAELGRQLGKSTSLGRQLKRQLLPTLPTAIADKNDGG